MEGKVLLEKYVLANDEKYKRVVDGIVGDKGQMVGGIGRDAPEEMIIAEYDKIAGLILTLDGNKIQTGTFWDFEKKKPREDVVEKIEVKKAGGGHRNVVNVDDTIPTTTSSITTRGRPRKN